MHYNAELCLSHYSTQVLSVTLLHLQPRMAPQPDYFHHDTLAKTAEHILVHEFHLPQTSLSGYFRSCSALAKCGYSPAIWFNECIPKSRHQLNCPTKGHIIIIAAHRRESLVRLHPSLITSVWRWSWISKELRLDIAFYMGGLTMPCHRYPLRRASPVHIC